MRRISRAVGTPCRPIGNTHLRREYGYRAHDVCLPPFHSRILARPHWRWRTWLAGRGNQESSQSPLVRNPYAAVAGRISHPRRSMLLQGDALYRRSLQGLGTFGEYGEAGRGRICAQLHSGDDERNAADIKAHWSRLGQGASRRGYGPLRLEHFRIRYREAYILEQLVSFRHRCPPAQDGEPARRTRVEGACGLHPRIHTSRQSAAAPGAGPEAAGEIDLRAADSFQWTR